MSLARVTKININLLCQCIRHSDSWTDKKSGYFSEASLTFHNHLKRGEIFVISSGNIFKFHTYFWGLAFDSRQSIDGSGRCWCCVEVVKLSLESFPAGRQFSLVTRPTHVCLKSMRCFPTFPMEWGKWDNLRFAFTHHHQHAAADDESCLIWSELTGRHVLQMWKKVSLSTPPIPIPTHPLRQTVYIYLLLVL